MEEEPPPPQPSYVRVLGSNDVVLGRGARISNFEGNVLYRQVIQARRVEYMSTGRHRLKKQIAHEIYASIRQRNGQFLDKVPTEDLQTVGLATGEEVWQQVSEEAAVRKIKQSLCEDEASVPRSASGGANFSSGGEEEPVSLPRNRQSMSVHPHQPPGNPSLMLPPLYLADTAAAHANVANAMLLHQQQQIQEGTRQLQIQQLQQQLLNNQLVQRQQQRQQMLVAEVARQQQQQLRNELSIVLATQQLQQSLNHQHCLLSLPLDTNNYAAGSMVGQMNIPSSQPLLPFVGGNSINPQISGLLPATHNGGLAMLSNPMLPYLGITSSSIQQSALSNAIAAAAVPNMHPLLYNPAATAPVHPPAALYGLAAAASTMPTAPLSLALPRYRSLGRGDGMTVSSSSRLDLRDNNMNETLVSATSGQQRNISNSTSNDEPHSETSTVRRPKKKRRRKSKL